MRTCACQDVGKWDTCPWFHQSMVFVGFTRTLMIIAVAVVVDSIGTRCRLLERHDGLGWRGRRRSGGGGAFGARCHDNNNRFFLKRVSLCIPFTFRKGARLCVCVHMSGRVTILGLLVDDDNDVTNGEKKDDRPCSSRVVSLWSCRNSSGRCYWADMDAHDECVSGER